jgi:hypothetical protein
MIVGIPNITYTLYMENTKNQREKEAKFQKKKQRLLKINAILADCNIMAKDNSYEILCRDVFYKENIQQMYDMYPDISKTDLDELVYKLYQVKNNWSLEIDIE